MAATLTFAAAASAEVRAALEPSICGAAGRAACLFASLAPPATATVGRAPASERAPLIVGGRDTERAGEKGGDDFFLFFTEFSLEQSDRVKEKSAA